MTEHDEGRRSISLKVEVPGTPEEVWEAIATGPGISAWFVPSEVDGREGGGDVVFHLGPDMDAPGTVTGWQPPERFAYEEQWAPAADTEPTTLATEFLVEARSAATCIVRLVSTFSAGGFDDDLDAMATGGPRSWTTCACTSPTSVAGRRRRCPSRAPRRKPRRWPGRRCWTRSGSPPPSRVDA